MSTLVPAGRLLLRGIGCGIVMGFGCGFLLVATVAFISEPSWSSFVFIMLLGLAGACIGALYGAVVGLTIAATVVLIASRDSSTTAPRVLGAVVGSVVVVVLSTLFFDPQLSAGSGETSRDALENILRFYVVPCTMAGVAGAFLAPRLLLRANRDSKEQHPDG